jgi:hypothetical protein
MSLTAQELLTAAYGTSTRNRPQTIADEQSELIGLLNRLTIELFLDAAISNPFWIGLQLSVDYSSELLGWPRPSRALALIRVETTETTTPALAVGTEVAVVAPDDVNAGKFLPTVIEAAQVLLKSSLPDSPQDGALTMWIARRATLLTIGGELSQTIDPAITDDMQDYFVHGVAAYLADKDGRSSEAAAHAAAKEAMRGLWLRLLESATPALRRRFAPRLVTSNATGPKA